MSVSFSAYKQFCREFFSLSRLFLCLIALIVFSPPAFSATTYEMKEVYIQDDPAQTVLYVIGVSAFRTLPALKEYVSQIPAGDTLKRIPASDIPLRGDPLLAPGAADDLKKLCESRGIKLEIVPRP